MPRLGRCAGHGSEAPLKAVARKGKTPTRMTGADPSALRHHRPCAVIALTFGLATLETPARWRGVRDVRYLTLAMERVAVLVAGLIHPLRDPPWRANAPS